MDTTLTSKTIDYPGCLEYGSTTYSDSKLQNSYLKAHSVIKKIEYI